MNTSNNKKPLVAIVGPSAVGKSGIAVSLAERLKAEIVSADSTLIYRRMDIGTAKPSIQERDRVPHHLIDVANPDENWSLADYRSAAKNAIEDILSHHKLPLLVGGTGQYIRAIVEGWHIPNAIPNSTVRKVLEDWMGEIGAKGLHTRLAVVDPQAANKIDPHNYRRTIRALEVIFNTGFRFSAQRTHGDTAFQVLFIGLTRPRQEIYARVDQRIEQMFQNGLIAEVQSLLNRGYSKILPAFSAIGYREVIDYLDGKISLEEAVIRMKKRTRVLIRHQANWFKPEDARISWHTVDHDLTGELEAEIRDWLVKLSNSDQFRDII